MPHDLETKSPRLRSGGSPKRWFDRYHVWVRRVAAVVILVSLLLLIGALPIQQLATGVEIWSQRLGYWGPVVYFSAFVLFTVCSIPVWPLPFVAGALFGTFWGAWTAWFSIVAAATITFWMSRLSRRTWLREYLEASPRMRALEKTVERANWKVVAAVRVSHFLTFGMQNYAFGLTRIGYGTFLAATCLASFPGTWLQVYLGDLGFASIDAWQSEAAPKWQVWGMRLGGLAIALVAVLYIGHLWKNVYRDAVERQLHQQLAAEAPKGSSAVWRSWSAMVMVVLALALAGAATWALVEREALRQSVEQSLPEAAAQTPDNPSLSEGLSS